MRARGGLIARACLHVIARTRRRSGRRRRYLHVFVLFFYVCGFIFTFGGLTFKCPRCLYLVGQRCVSRSRRRPARGSARAFALRTCRRACLWCAFIPVPLVRAFARACVRPLLISLDTVYRRDVLFRFCFVAKCNKFGLKLS